MNRPISDILPVRRTAAKSIAMRRSRISVGNEQRRSALPLPESASFPPVVTLSFQVNDVGIAGIVD